MNNCRGQGYDNGANMVGKKKGVQARILEKFSRAFFNPCGCHSVNLVIGDAVSPSVKNVSLFGVLQRLFVLFCWSTKRWKILKASEIYLTLKEVSETRWECRIDSLKSVRYQLAEISDALASIQELNDPKASSEAKTLEAHITSFDFIVSLIIWYDVLFQINLVSKNVQGMNMDLPTAVSLMKKCEQFQKEYRDSGYDAAIATAKEIAETLSIDPVFPAAPSRKKKRQFLYEGKHEVNADPEIRFKTTVFYPLIDTAISSVQQRFAQLDTHCKIWGFLYNMQKLPDYKSLKSKCLNLQDILLDQASGESDIDGQELTDELIHLQAVVKNSDTETPIQTLQYIFKQIW